MRVFKTIILLFIIFILGCDKSENIDDFLYKTWKLDWKQCGIYQNRYDAQMNLTQSDTLDYGWFLEQSEDTIKFNFTIVSNQELILTDATDSVWAGVLLINNISKGTFVFEKEVKECSNEIYHFE